MAEEKKVRKEYTCRRNRVKLSCRKKSRRERARKKRGQETEKKRNKAGGKRRQLLGSEGCKVENLKMRHKIGNEIRFRD